MTHGPYPDRGRAQRIEHQLKRRSGERRLSGPPPELDDDETETEETE